MAGGAAGWRAAGAPWREPGKLVLPSVDLRSIGKGLDTLAEDFKARRGVQGCVLWSQLWRAAGHD